MSEDVKQEAKAASAEASTETKEVVKDTEEKYETEQQIPYAVFKERNSKLRETEKKLKSLEKDMEVKVQDMLYKKEMDLRREYENKLAAAKTDSGDLSYGDEKTDDVKALKEELDSLRKQVTEVSTATEQDRINKTIANLKYEFPDLSAEHVLSIKRVRPEWSWEDCAEYSHNHFKTEIDSRYKKMIETKKQAATKKVTGAEGLRNMKPEERPKNFSDAAKRAAQFLGDDN